MRYKPSKLVVSCSDDGIGFPHSQGDIPLKPGHWGLVGMRERATKVEETLSVVSTPSEGTCVVASAVARLLMSTPYQLAPGAHSRRSIDDPAVSSWQEDYVSLGACSVEVPQTPSSDGRQRSLRSPHQLRTRHA